MGPALFAIDFIGAGFVLAGDQHPLPLFQVLFGGFGQLFPRDASHPSGAFLLLAVFADPAAVHGKVKAGDLLAAVGVFDLRISAESSEKSAIVHVWIWVEVKNLVFND